MAEPGRPTDLTDELTLEIRKLVLEQLPYKDIQQILGVAPGTWDGWVYNNTKDFRDLLSQWKHERMVKKAEVKVDALIDSEDENVALKASTFTLETLGKEKFSKRSELTGAEGKDLPTPILHVLRNNDSDTQDKQPQQEN
jgi:hypothetical protein